MKATVSCNCHERFCKHHSAGEPCPNPASDPPIATAVGDKGQPIDNITFGYCETCWANHQANHPEHFSNAKQASSRPDKPDPAEEGELGTERSSN